MEPPVPTKRSREWVGWVVAVVAVVVFIGMFVVPAVLRSRCGAQGASESTFLRQLAVEVEQQSASGETVSIAGVLYDSGIDLSYIDNRCAVYDFSRARMGKFTMREIAARAMTREDLAVEIERLGVGASGWDRLGPITMCVDPRAFVHRRAGIVVGWLAGDGKRSGATGWPHVAFSDGRVDMGAQDLTPEMISESIAYYASIGIPMPEEMVRELREAMGMAK